MEVVCWSVCLFVKVNNPLNGLLNVYVSYAPNSSRSPKMSNSDASLSERTCFFNRTLSPQARTSILEENLNSAQVEITSFKEEEEALQRQLKEKTASVEQALREADQLDAQLDEVCQFSSTTSSPFSPSFSVISYGRYFLSATE